MSSFASPIYTLKHNEKSAAEAVAWESHTAEDREHMPRGTEHITLAVLRGGMGYCFVSLCIWERIDTISQPSLPPPGGKEHDTKEKRSCLPTHAASCSAHG